MTLIQFGLAGLVLAVVAVVVSWLWPLVRGKLSPTAQTAGDKATAFVDEALFLGLLAPPYGMAVKRNDAIIKDLLNRCRLQSATWDDAPPIVLPAPLVTAFDAITIQRLATENAELKAALAKATIIPPTISTP